ncbi:MAG: T9SS type A sorting domain-containing protein [Rhodothermales bacterium]
MSVILRRISVQGLSILVTIVCWTICGAFVFGQNEVNRQNRKLATQSTQNERDNLETFGGLPFITNAGPYTVQTGASNPLSGVDIGTESALALVDIDNDGDLDLFAGEDDGTINYFENTGSASAATYVQRTGGSNPFNGVDVGGYAYPAIVDIDNDGDFDVFISDEDVSLFYYKNTGSVSAATFTLQTGGSNPFNGVSLSIENKPGFVDIDNDGDYDAFGGDEDGNVYYFENTGSAASPTFVERTGASNPLDGEDIGGYSTVGLYGNDYDGDLDVFIGEGTGVINYFENTDNPVLFGPGGITTDLALWLKADAGVTESSNVVSAWADQTANSNDASQGTPSYQPTYESNALNYNPGILFAEDFLGTSLDINPTSVPDVSVVFVYTPSTDPAGALWGISNGDWNRCIWDDATWNNSVSIGTAGSTDNVTNLFVSGQANITTVAYDEDASNGSSVYVNGVLQRQFTADQASLTANNFSVGTWGGGAAANDKYQGRVFEGIVYSALLSSQDLNQVQTYLGLKYGISLAHDYEASDATTLWDATTNATYHNDVAGIGRDDLAELNQKQSTSQSGGIVEIGLGTLAVDNASNANTFSTDLNYLIWGHDNASTTVATVYSGSSTNTRMARIWKVEETGTVGTVEIQIPDTYDATHLIVSANSSLTSPTEVVLTDNGDGTRSTTVDFTDGQFFTFGKNDVAPGGVTGNLELWLKADAGRYTDDTCSTAITSSDNADAVACWEDQAGNGHASTQSTSGYRPDYNSAGINYNPSFSFDEVEDDYLQFSTIPIATATDVHAYYVIDDNDGDGVGNIYQNNGPNNGRTYLMSNTASFGDNASVSDTSPSGYYLATAEYDVGTTTMYFNIDAGTNINESLNFSVTPAGPARMGAYGGGVGSDSWHFNGEIAEFIVYTTDHGNADDEQKIQSYLAIKYSITLPNDLLATDGTTLWNATTNATYNNGVAGIGRDDGSALNQKQSTSESGGIVEIGLSALAVDNATNANTFSADVSFMIWGHDNASSSLATSFSGTNVLTRMARVWKVEETGTVGTVEIQIPDTYDATHLIVSANSSLTSPTEVVLTDNGDGTRSTTVDFTDGQFFSFGVGPTPGGVSADIELWLKADAGVTEAAGDVTTWADQSGSGRDAVDNGAANLPSMSGTDVNYNPIIEFDGSNSEGLKTSSVFGTATHSNVNLFLVAKTNTAGTDWALIEGTDVSSNRVGLHLPHTSTIYWDAGAASGSNRLQTAWTETAGQEYIWSFEYESATPEQTIYRDGASIATDATVASFNFSSSYEFQIASELIDGAYYDGEIAEVIVYPAFITDTEQDRIESYLAIKYGVTLSHDYLASDATTLWDATTNATYHNDVIGIGRDDVSALYQKQSGASIVTAALGTLAADNASNANTISTDLTFLVMGHNAGALTESAVTVGAYTADQLARKWFAEETNDTGSTLEFKFDLTGLTISGTTAAEFKLVLDTDNDPSNGTRQIISAASFASDIVTFSSVDVEDNDYLILLTDYDLVPVGPPVSDGATADGVLGQPDFDSATGNNGGVSSTALNGPTYFAMGPTGKIFVSDSKNHRVMRWSSANAAVNGSAAEAVLGQADFTSNTANRGSAVAANTMYDPTGLFVTSTGALFVSDSQNNRILRFDNAESVSSGAAADGVLGQADFVSFEANRRQNVAANSLRWPKDLYVDSGGRLWAVDWLNHRVLRYDSATSKADGTDADGVIGQPDFTSREIEWKNQTDANSLVYPAGVYVDGAGRLWVNDAGNSRVLRFDTAASKANGADADGVLGQADFTSWRVNRGGETAANTLRWPDAGIDGDNQGGIWVADRWGDRVLWYEDAATKLDGAAADGVLGQPDFVTSHGTVDDDSFNGAHDVFIDSGSDQIWIIDNAHNRVLRFDATAASLSKIPDGPEIEEVEIPVMYALYQNYPNPFNPSTTIGFDLPESVHVRINVYDMLGRPVHTLIDEDMPAGKHEVQFDASDLASGVYFYQMQAAEEVHLKKMLLLK